MSPGLERSGSRSNSSDESGDGLNSPHCPVCNAAKEDDDSDDDVLQVNLLTEHWHMVLQGPIPLVDGTIEEAFCKLLFISAKQKE